MSMNVNADIQKAIEDANKKTEECSCCGYHGLEKGDTLYISADWDGGIGFDYIRDVKYCPVCGKQLI